MRRALMIALLLGQCWTQSLPAAEPESDLTYGSRQVERMLADRPAMAQFTSKEGVVRKLTCEDSIWQWAARAYGKKVRGLAMEWDNAEVSGPSQYHAEHIIPREGTKGSIRIREMYLDGKQMRKATFDEMWSCCIFELINMTNDDKFLEHYQSAIEGKMTKPEWVRLNTGLEYSALRQLKAFFDEAWLPWSQKNHHSYEALCWTRHTAATYEEWMAQYQNSGVYKHWEDYYDNSIVPYLKKMEEYQAQKRAGQ